MKLISCPNCAGQGHITDPVLQSSVVETCCPVCKCTGEVEPKYAILNRYCEPQYENGELKGWNCAGTFVPSAEVEPEEVMVSAQKTLQKAPAI